MQQGVAKSAVLTSLHRDTLDPCNNALAYLDVIEARGVQVVDKQLREIARMMVQEARTALTGAAGWKQDQVECLIWQILDGVFEQTVQNAV